MTLMAYTAAELTAQFLDAANPETARHLMRFFKTDEGQYGYGDQFLGLSVSATRALIKPFLGKLPLDDCNSLI